MASLIRGRTLVRGGGGGGGGGEPGKSAGADFLLHSTVSLSFWGGIDPKTALIIDQTHPLHGQSVADIILAIPSGRGSCTGSQVLLELILNGIAPRAIVTRDADPILCVGAIIAEEVFGGDKEEILANVPTIISLGRHGFDQLSDKSHASIVADENGSFAVAVGSSKEQVEEKFLSKSTIQNTENEIDADTYTPSNLQLSEEELSILAGQSGTPADQMALRTICRVASITNSPKLMPVTQAHIDGCTYIGPGGLQFVEKLVDLGGKVCVPTTLNSVSADRRRWASLGVSKDLAIPANKVGDAYLKLGCTMSFTCAPYLLPSRPGLGENIIWGESNAVVYANSVLGARTDKYADYFDICAALVGRVPLYGVHLDENRAPGIVVDVEDIVEEYVLPLMGKSKNCPERIDVDALWPILGYQIGNLSDGMIAIVVGMEALKEFITDDDLKAFCAAFGTTGAAPLVHIAQITPEAMDPSSVDAMIEGCKGRSVKITHQHLIDTYNILDGGGRDDDKKTDSSDMDLLVLFGNPHLSLDECERLATLVSTAPKRDPSVKVMATLSRHIYSEADSRGYVKTMEDFGVQFVNDTCWCMLLDPPIIPPNPDATIMTNSGKYAHYGPGLTNRRFRFGSMSQCIKAATGTSPPSPPRWLVQKRCFATALVSCLTRGRAGRLVIR